MFLMVDFSKHAFFNNLLMLLLSYLFLHGYYAGDERKKRKIEAVVGKLGAALRKAGTEFLRWGETPGKWGRCFVIGETVPQNALRMAVVRFGVQNVSGQGANLSRDGFHKHFRLIPVP